MSDTPVDEDRSEPVAFEDLLQQTLKDSLASGGAQAVAADQLQTLSERLDAIEAAQAALLTRMDEWEAGIRRDIRAAVMEIGSLHSDLIGERKYLSTLSVFNGMMPLLDSVRALKLGLKAEYGSPAYRQVDAMHTGLLMMLRGFGYIEYMVEVGAAFDPLTMEVIDFGEGEPGQVVDMLRPGFRSPNGVLRPAGVRIAKSAGS